VALHSVFNGFVGVEVPSLGKSFGAPRVRTLIGLLACVDSNVSFKVEVHRKALFAVRTLKRSFASVDQLVPFEFRVVFKALFTDLALIVFHFITNYSLY